jgi:hypothetical protein
MSGLPLQVADLPPGIVIVRVIRQSFAQNIAGQPVELHRASGRVMTAVTDADGRARFEGLQVTETVHARTIVEGEPLASQRFEIPAQGGVRLVLVAGVGAGSAWAAAASAAAAEPTQPDGRSDAGPTQAAIPLVVGFVGVGGGVVWMARRPRRGQKAAAPAQAPEVATPETVPASDPASVGSPDLEARREEAFARLMALEAGRDRGPAYTAAREALIEDLIAIEAALGRTVH